MVGFIVRMIEKEAKVSIEKGQEKYRAYFVNTSLYLGYQSAVNAKLEADGYEDVIVAE